MVILSMIFQRATPFRALVLLAPWIHYPGPPSRVRALLNANGSRVPRDICLAWDAINTLRESFLLPPLYI